MKKIAVYCGSSDKIEKSYLDAAYDLGKLMAQKNIGLVYGGGKTGLMGKVADGAMENEGEAIGITVEHFSSPHFLPEGITQLEVKKTMHERKARIAELSDGFIALPGGFGTMDEFFEILTWAQIGIHTKPIGVLNINGFYDDLIRLFASFKKTGFTYDFHDGLYFMEEDPEILIKKMENYKASGQLHEWIERTST